MSRVVTSLKLAQPILLVGARVDQASAAMLMMHGRGASARDILTNVAALNDPRFTYLAPEAPDHTWYPLSFRAPLQDNEPHLSSSLALISEIMAWLAVVGLPPERVVLFGFSQGASLVLEWTARNARRYGGVVGLSGGLIGPDDRQRDDRGWLGGSPVFLGCSDVDPYIPKDRAEHAAEHLRHLGGSVTLRLYPDMGHTVNEDELQFVRGLLTNGAFDSRRHASRAFRIP